MPPELAATITEDEARRRLGSLADGAGMVANTIFPNFSWLGSIRTIRVWHPHGSRAMGIWSRIIVDADWTPEVKQAYRRHSSLRFSTTDAFETDDSENWAETAATSAGCWGRSLVAEPPREPQVPVA